MKRWAAPLIAAALYACFWATASVSEWFLDKPFWYLGRANWDANLAESGTRWLLPNETMLAGAAIAFLLPAIAITAWYLARRVAVDPFAWFAARDGAERGTVAISAAIAIAMAVAVAYAVLRKANLLDDERAYLFQANLFGHGTLGLPSPPAALRNPLILTTPMWTSGYPPGQSLALAPAMRLHAEHVLPALFAGVIVVALWSFARDAFGPKHGMLAALLAGTSTFVWAVHGTVLAIGTSATFLAVFLAALARAERTGRARWMVAAGLAVGFAFITRPFDALAFATPVALRLLWRVRTPGGARRLAACAIGFAAIAWIIPMHDYLVTGDWATFPWSSPDKPGFELGFAQKSMGTYGFVHSPAQAIGNLVGVFARLDLWTFGWPCAVLLVVAGLVRKASAWDVRLRAIFASYLLFFVLIPYPGTSDVGPTYYYPLVPILIALAVRGVSGLRGWLDALIPSGAGSRAIAWAVLAGIGVAITAVFPLRAARLTSLASEVRAPWEMIEASDIGPAIVVVPPPVPRDAPGWAYGYPYALQARGGRVDLIEPHSAEELAEAVAYLGEKPVYRLSVDHELFKTTGVRTYTLEPWPHAPAAP